MQQNIPEIRNSDDPRLNIPSVTLSEIHSLGCLFPLLNLLPLIPILFSVFAQNMYLLITQACMLITLIIWISNLLFNNTYVEKVRTISRPGEATLVDKFIDRSTDSTKNTLVYMFNHQTKDGEIQKLQARCRAVSPELFNSPIGSKLQYYSMPLKSRFLSVANYHPFSWYMATPDQLAQDLQKWKRTSAQIILGSSLIAIWLKAGLLSAAGKIPELSFQEVIFHFSSIFLTTEPFNYLLPVAKIAPTLPLVSIIALFLVLKSTLQDQE